MITFDKIENGHDRTNLERHLTLLEACFGIDKSTWADNKKYYDANLLAWHAIYGNPVLWHSVSNELEEHINGLIAGK